MYLIQSKEVALVTYTEPRVDEEIIRLYDGMFFIVFSLSLSYAHVLCHAFSLRLHRSKPRTPKQEVATQKQMSHTKAKRPYWKI